MSYETEIEFTNTIGLVVMMLVAFFLIILLLDYYIRRVVPYQRRARYIKMEIGRSHGRERERWERRLKRHYVRAIPFIGKRIARNMKRNSSNKH